MQTTVFSKEVIDRAQGMVFNFKKLARELKGRFYDAQLGIDTLDEVKNPTSRFMDKSRDVSRNKDMFIYGPVFYGMLKRISRMFYWTADDVFIDLGCGKGRAVFYMARQRLREVIGVELDAGLMAAARRNLQTFKGARTPIVFVQEDAARYKFTDENIVFINNSFGYETLETVLSHLRESLADVPRKIIILYLNPQHKEVMDAQKWLSPVKHTKDMDTCYIWSNR